MTKTKQDLWFINPRPRPEATLKLFCFPYAGGAGTMYNEWAEDFPASIELHGVQPPGRGRRLMEPAFNRLTPLLENLGPVFIEKHLDDKPFAFFGHSMGALTSFELSRYIRRQTGREPLYLFASGHRAPHLPSRHKPIYQKPKDAFLDELRRYNGTPPEIFQHEELLSLLIPSLRSDFALCEVYNHQSETPLSCPIYAFGGISDPKINRDEIAAWQILTTGPFQMRMFPGDHFFLRDVRPTMTAIMRQQLQQVMNTI